MWTAGATGRERGSWWQFTCGPWLGLEGGLGGGREAPEGRRAGTAAAEGIEVGEAPMGRCLAYRWKEYKACREKNLLHSYITYLAILQAKEPVPCGDRGTRSLQVYPLWLFIPLDHEALMFLLRPNLGRLMWRTSSPHFFGRTSSPHFFLGGGKGPENKKKGN